MLKTSYWAKPIPIRRFDWACWDDNRGEEALTTYGTTESEAIANYQEEFRERDDA